VDEKTPDAVAEATRAREQAQASLEALQVQIVEHEDRVEQAWQQVIRTINLRLIAKEANFRSYLPPDDPLVQTVDRQLEEAVQRLREARAAREGLAQAISDARRHVAACEQGVQEARRRVYLTQHHGALLAHLEALRAEDPRRTLDSMAPRYMAQVAGWRAQIIELEKQLASVLEGAGV
jgi:hypothetical protein